MKKTIVKISELPNLNKGFFPDPKLDALFYDFKKLKPLQSLKLEFKTREELERVRNGFSNRRKKYTVPEMRLIRDKAKNTLYVLKMPYNKEEDDELGDREFTKDYIKKRV